MPFGLDVASRRRAACVRRRPVVARWPRIGASASVQIMQDLAGSATSAPSQRLRRKAERRTDVQRVQDYALIMAMYGCTDCRDALFENPEAAWVGSFRRISASTR